MKKFLLALFVGILSLSLAACNNDEDKAKEKETEEKATGEEEAAVDPEEMQKKLDAQKVEEDTVVAIVNGKEIKGLRGRRTQALGAET